MTEKGSNMTDVSITTEPRPRRRNPGAGTGENQVRPLRIDEKRLRKLSARLGETERLYRERDELVIRMYDHGYTHRQIADLINSESESPLTYDAVGRVIRNARRAGVDI